MERLASMWQSKRTQVVLFSSTAIALYGYDQGMMSLINTNYSYLHTMGIRSASPLVGIIVSVYYLGCAVGAVLFSAYADKFGRRKAIFASLATTSLGNLLMFASGLGGLPGALVTMFAGRIIMGLGVGGIDAVIPTYTAELASDEARGKALAQEFQMNIFGLNMAFAINLGITRALGKGNQWAWRTPIAAMQIYPVILMSFISALPESPRWYMFKGEEDRAKRSLEKIYDGDGEEDERDKKFEELKESKKNEEGNHVGYTDMFTPGHSQFHATAITIMVQVNQALTGYGAVSVYGPQIFELLGFTVQVAENLTMANYISYFALMTLAWLLIDAVGRRGLLLWGSLALVVCFLLLAVFGGMAEHAGRLHVPQMAVAVPGILSLFTATGAFGIGWLATVWLIPTEIFPTSARAQAAAVSVVVWGLANFAITLLTPIMFNNLGYWLFLVFALTNTAAGAWTFLYLPESGNRSFDENVEFFGEAGEAGTWVVSRVKGGEWKHMPYDGVLIDGTAEAHERQPLLRRVRDQVP